MSMAGVIWRLCHPSTDGGERQAGNTAAGPVSEVCSLDQNLLVRSGSPLPQHSRPTGSFPAQGTVCHSSSGMGKNCWANPLTLQPSWVLESPGLGARTLPVSSPSGY